MLHLALCFQYNDIQHNQTPHDSFEYRYAGCRISLLLYWLSLYWMSLRLILPILVTYVAEIIYNVDLSDSELCSEVNKFSI